MPVNVREADRDQLWLMPPSVADWLPEDHLAWFILDAVKELDLSGFYASYRADGRGGATYDPAAMLAVLLYAYCSGERSSRRIERRLIEDIAYRVLSANQHPDHATLARFRQRHEGAIAELFVQILGLCVDAGLVDSGLIAIDGTKMEADASYFADRTKAQLVKEILAEAERTDNEEDERFGDRRGDELPGEWASRAGRRERIREALRQIEDQAPRDYETKMAARMAKEAELGRKFGGRKLSPTSQRSKRPNAANVTDPDSAVMKGKGASPVQGYNAQVAATADQIVVATEVTNAPADATNFLPMTRAITDTLCEAGHYEAVSVIVADAGYWSTENAIAEVGTDVLIATAKERNLGGHRAHSPQRRFVLERIRNGEITLRQGAELLGISYQWMVNLAAHYVEDEGTVAITDPAQRQAVVDRIDAGELSVRAAAYELDLSPLKVRKLLAAHRNSLPDPTLVRQRMEEKLVDPDNQALYRKRQTSIEPVFGNIKGNRGYRRFARRGMTAVSSEWRLICATHNLMKLWRISPAG
jgi:transposase